MMPHHWRPLAHEQNSIFKCKQHTCFKVLQIKQMTNLTKSTRSQTYPRWRRWLVRCGWRPVAHRARYSDPWSCSSSCRLLSSCSTSHPQNTTLRCKPAMNSIANRSSPALFLLFVSVIRFIQKQEVFFFCIY